MRDAGRRELVRFSDISRRFRKTAATGLRSSA